MAFFAGGHGLDCYLLDTADVIQPVWSSMLCTYSFLFQAERDCWLEGFTTNPRWLDTIID